MKPSKYSLKVWQTGVFLSAVAITIYMGQMQVRFTDHLFTWVILMFFGEIFSIPAFLLLWLVVHVLSGTQIKWVVKNIILSLTGTVLTMLTFLLLNVRMFLSEGFNFALIVCASSIVAGIWLYSIKRTTA